jgi:hypothetical protein
MAGGQNANNALNTLLASLPPLLIKKDTRKPTKTLLWHFFIFLIQLEQILLVSVSKRDTSVYEVYAYQMVDVKIVLKKNISICWFLALKSAR